MTREYWTTISEGRAQEETADQIGLLVENVDVPKWLAAIRHRFSFMAELDKVEAELLKHCNYKDRKLVEKLKAELPGFQQPRAGL